MDVAIVLFDGFDDLDAIGPFEVFDHARAAGADLSVGLYTLAPQAVVTSSHGLRIQPDGVLPPPSPEADATPGEEASAVIDSQDLLLVPGGGWSSRAEASVRTEVERGDLPAAIARFHDAGTTVASVCTGAMLLAAAGLTDGRPAVTHHSAIEDLEAAGAEVVDARVVDDGDLVTAGGITAGLDLALHLLDREFGSELARQVAGEMEYDPQGEVVTGSG